MFGDIIGGAVNGLANSVLGGGSSGGSDAIGDMKAAFDHAIEKASEITVLTTTKKVELDAAKQRPNL